MKKNQSITFFFECVAANYVCSCAGKAIGAPTRLDSFSEFFWWFPQFSHVSYNVQIGGITSICSAIWRTRNKYCLEGKLIKSPYKLIYYSAVFMKYWEGLNSVADQDALRTGTEAIANVSLEIQNPNPVIVAGKEIHELMCQGITDEQGMGVKQLRSN
jgi:hypothetical protein